MTCGQDSGQEVKRTQSCRSPYRTAPAAATGRKTSLVHFHPVHQLMVEGREPPANEGAQRLRNFESTKRGRIVNRGDSFRRESTKVSPWASDDSGRESSSPLQRSATLPSLPDPLREPCELSSRVLVLGTAGVGKAALCRQFETSEYTNGCEQAVEYDDARRRVTVCLDNIEMELTVEKQTCFPLSVPDESTVQAHDALVVVYSVTDAASFATARAVCQATSNLGLQRPVIVVANKCDLVRLRKVTSKDGRSLAVQFGFKYIETSVVINSNIDELLGGVVAQIRFFQQFENHYSVAESEKLVRQEKQRKRRFKSRTLPSAVVKEIFMKVVGQKEYKSCENLLVV